MFFLRAPLTELFPRYLRPFKDIDFCFVAKTDLLYT